MAIEDEVYPNRVFNIDDLPAYNGDAICPKCDHDTVGTLYCLSCNWDDSGSHYFPCQFCADLVNGYGDLPSKYGQHEHSIPVLHRKCRRCGYMWNEKPVEGGDDESCR